MRRATERRRRRGRIFLVDGEKEHGSGLENFGSLWEFFSSETFKHFMKESKIGINYS